METVRRIAMETFGTGGAGVVLIQLMIIAVSGWLLSYIATAAQQGQIAGMIKIVTTFTCIGLVAATVYRAIGAVATAMGLS